MDHPHDVTSNTVNLFYFLGKEFSSDAIFDFFYTSGQPNWENNYTIREFQDFSASQILREINFDNFEAPKKYYFDHLSRSEF